MKRKYFKLLPIAAFMVACSNEMEDVYTAKDVSNLASRTCISDSSKLGKLVYLEETEELRKLKQLSKEKLANQFQSYFLGALPDDFFSSNMYAIRELPITIQVRSIASGSTSGYTYLYCTGAGQEVTLSNVKSSFYLKILPASSGIPYLIYSNASKTPLSVGYYTNNPNNKILISAKDNSGSLFSASWNLLPSSYYKGYFTIESESYLGQSDPDNMWSVFNYVLEAKGNNKLGYGQPVNNKAQQEFMITPTCDFNLTDLKFDLDNATVTEGQLLPTTFSLTNIDYFEKTEKIEIEFAGQETSFFNETRGTLNLNVTDPDSMMFQRPQPISGKAVITKESPKDAKYLTSTEKFNVTKTFETSIDMKPRCLLQLKAKLKTFTLNVPYVVTAQYKYNNELREVKVKGVWKGFSLANPYHNTPIMEPHFYDLESGNEIHYTLEFNKERNIYTIK